MLALHFLICSLTSVETPTIGFLVLQEIPKWSHQRTNVSHSKAYITGVASCTLKLVYIVRQQMCLTARPT